MAKSKIQYYRSEDKTIYVAIDYETLYHDYYSKEGRKRLCLGAATDRIEAFLIRKNYVKVNKLIHDKFRESLAIQLPTSPILAE
jgi:hypothetical protein